MKKLFLFALATALTVVLPAAAATFTADFNTGTVPAGSSVSGTAAVTATGGVGNTGVLRLTEAVGGQVGAWLINDFSGGAAVNAFNATFKVELGNGTVPPADGFSFNWATDLTGSGSEEGEGTGLTIAFDTFDNGGGEAPAIDIKWFTNVIAHSAVPFDFSAANAAFVTVQVTLTNGAVTVLWNGTTVHSGIVLAGFASFSGAKFGFGARTGGSTERHYVDDVSIVTTPGSGAALAKMTAALQTDGNGNGLLNPGDNLRYTVVLSNNTAGTLSNVVYNSGSVSNAPQVGGSLRATPLARADGPVANSVPGNAFHGALNTTLSVPAVSGLLANDFLGLPAAQIASFGGGGFGASVTANAAGATAVAAGVGSLTANADGGLTFVPNATFNGLITFQYRLTNSSGFSDATVQLGIGNRPSATNDAFTVTGNTLLDSALIPATVLVNDTGDLVGVSGNTAPAHGTASVAANGQFTYNPAAGYTGADSFTYTLTNGWGAVVATVNLTVTNKLWYIDNSVGVNGDGRSSSPFKQTSDFTTANDGGAGHPADNDLVFLRQGSGNYTGSTTLRLGQKLIGDGASGTFSSLFGFSLAAGSAKAAGVAVPALTGTRPFISVASGTGVTLGNGNSVRGLNVNTTNGKGITGTNVGTLTVTNVIVGATGGAAVDINTGAAVVTLDTASSTNSSAQGINLSNVTGTVTINGGNIVNPAAAAFLVNGGTVGVTCSAAISQANNAALVAVTNHATGTLTFQTGALTASNGTGLQFNNADGIYNFSGAVSLNGGDAGIDIENGSDGSFTFNNAPITNPTGAGFRVNGGGGSIGHSGAITKSSAGQVVDIQGRTGGSVTLNGNITANTSALGILVQSCTAGTITFAGASKSLSTGGNTAVNLASNTGATINFSNGGLSITTTTGTGFNATGGGTISVTGTANIISSGNGSGLNVVSTAIGASGLTFQSINKNGGSVSAIILSSTGSGTVTITGTGSAGSGGTIQNISGADAISLNTVGGRVALNSMIIQDITAANDSSAANDTRSNVDAIQGQQVNGGLTLNNTTIQRISDDGINGSVDGVNPTATVFNGLTISNCLFQDINRFNVSGHADAQEEAAVYIFGIKGTVSVTGSTFQRAGSGLFLMTDTAGSLDMTVTGNSFLTLYKEIGTLSQGLFGINVTQKGSLTSVVRIGDKNDADPALGNTFTNGGDRASIRVISDTGSTGAMKAEIARNTFTITDHSSPGQPAGNTIYNFPQGGVLLRALGSGNYDGFFASNLLDQVMHADGGIGQLSLIAENGACQFIVQNNTFKLPWDASVEMRADGFSGGQTSCKVLFQNNTYVDGTVGDGTTDLGGPSPYDAFYVQARNNGRLDFTMKNEATPLGLTDTSSAHGSFSFYCQTTSAGDVLNLFLQNIQGPRGYRLLQAASTTFNLYRNGSASGTAQGVLQDNGNRGGAGVDTTNPPAVTTSGTITLSTSVPALPSITIQ